MKPYLQYIKRSLKYQVPTVQTWFKFNAVFGVTYSYSRNVNFWCDEQPTAKLYSICIGSGKFLIQVKQYIFK